MSGARLEPLVTARTPSGGPLSGALRVAETDTGYPIVDSVARLTAEAAQRYSPWLKAHGLRPPSVPDTGVFQAEATVDSFGFQWNWNSKMRSEADLAWRAAARFKIEPAQFAGKLLLDAGAGAGDQSQWFARQGARVVSVDLSSAIDVVAAKMRLCPEWVGVQGDIMALPFQAEQFDVLYCEGVIQHTRDSARAVRELSRVLRSGGLILATHYEAPARLLARLKHRYISALRRRLSRWDRHKLLLFAGMVAACSYIPLVGHLLRLSGTAVRYDLMPDFKTTWTNTYDLYGGHTFQRYISPREFWSYFEQAAQFEPVYTAGGVVAARKLS